MASSDKLRAVQHARYYNQFLPLFLDTETTGLTPQSEIVEVCVIDHNGVVLLDTLVHPTHSIPWDAILVHGITDEMVSSAPTWQQVWPQMEDILRGRYVGIYNAEFDLRMMRQSHSLYGMPWQGNIFTHFCIMKLYARFYGQARGRYGTPRWQSLSDAARQCGIAHQNAHRAQADTRMAMAVFERIFQEY
jgi:DNA polymerase-3 subunit epsilon